MKMRHDVELLPSKTKRTVIAVAVVVAAAAATAAPAATHVAKARHDAMQQAGSVR